jgi:phospholipid/cholesterol/gamma-HCH transport system permease protein
MSAAGQARSGAPQAETGLKEGRMVLFLSGAWSILTLGPSSEQSEKIKHMPDLQRLRAIDMHGVTELDTAGAMLINKLRLLPQAGLELPLSGARQSHLDILALCLPAPAGEAAAGKPVALPGLKARSQAPAPWHALGTFFLSPLGERMVSLFMGAMERLGFFGQFLVTLGKNIARPREVRWVSIVHNMEQTGAGAIPIVALLSFLIGVVLSYMAATQMASFGAQILVVNLLDVAIMREMGVLLTSILIAGRSGSSYTAQLGSMAANQEIDAMRSMGLDPMHMLVVPKVTALVLMLPMLVIVADFSGMLGGLAAVWLSLDITPEMFMEALQRTFKMQNFLVGLVKAPFFALAIGCIGCFDGLKVKGSADSVGRMTTRSVVESIFTVIALDAIFAIFFTTVRI